MTTSRDTERPHHGPNELRAECPCGFGGDVLALWEANERAGRSTRIYGEGPLAMIVGPVSASAGMFDVELYVYCGRCGKQHPSSAPMRVTIDAPYARLSRYGPMFKAAGWKVDTAHPVSLEVFPVLTAERIAQPKRATHRAPVDGEAEAEAVEDALKADMPHLKCDPECHATGPRFATWYAVKRGDINEEAMPLVGAGPRAVVMGPVHTWLPWEWLDVYGFCASCGRTFEGLNGARIRAGRRSTRPARIEAALREHGFKSEGAHFPRAIFPTFALKRTGCGCVPR